MTILSIVQNVAPVIGIPRPLAIVGSTSAQVNRLLGLANIGGRSLARSWAWNALTRRVTFNGTAANAQANQPPVDFQRFPMTQRIWSVQRRTWLVGPASPNEWDGILTRPQIAYPGYWYMLDGLINIAPAPATTDTFTYSYVSKNWIRPQGAPPDHSADIAAWGADTDTALLDESLLELDLIWRFKQATQLDYAEDMTTFEREKEKAIGRDPGPKEITTTDPYSEGPPEGYWPGTISY